MNNTQNTLTPEQELEMLREENQQKEKVSKELDRLWEMFPEVRMEDMPDEMWTLVENGESLLGAYCITLMKKQLELQSAQQKNTENSMKTPPPVKNGGEAKEYFTREQVSKMTREQVRKNYSKIVDSMKYWN